jgi:hypothetical protein
VKNKGAAKSYTLVDPDVTLGYNSDWTVYKPNER